MSGIETLVNEYKRQVFQSYGTQGENFEFFKEREQFSQVNDWPLQGQMLWTGSLLLSLEKKTYGDLIRLENDSIRQALYAGVELIQRFPYSVEISLLYSSLDLIMQNELNECANLIDVLKVLEPLASLTLIHGRKFSYLTIAKGKISLFTLKFMRTVKTISTIIDFLSVFKELYAFSVDLLSITWKLISSIMDFIEEECFVNQNRNMFNDCFNILQILKNICLDDDQAGSLSLIHSKFNNIPGFKSQPLPQIPNPSNYPVNSMPPIPKPSNYPGNSMPLTPNPSNYPGNSIQCNLPIPIYYPGQVRNPNNQVATQTTIKLSDITKQTILFCNNMQNEQIKARIDKGYYQGKQLVLKVYEIPESKLKEIPKIEKEIKSYENLSRLNKNCFLKFYGRANENLSKPGISEKFIKLVILLERCPKSLADLIKERCETNIRFQENELFEMFYSLLDGFETMRGLGLLHQDIKPDNIMIGDDGKVKIIDFESCFFRPTGCSFTGIKASYLVGTQNYLSPEKLNCILVKNSEGRSVEYDLEKSDIFSLGLVFYQLYCCSNSVIYRDVEDLHKSVRSWKSYSSYLKNLIVKMLERNPEERVNFRGAISMMEQPENFK